MKASGRIGLHGCKWPLLAAAGVRLALLCATLLRSGTAVITSGDTASYLEPGRNLLLHGQFITGVTPELDRTPGYPLFLALISLHGAALAAFLQVIVSVLSVLLVARLAMALFADERVAILAAWLFAFEPVSVIFSVRLLAETLFLALILLSLERLAVFLRDHRLSVLAVAGIWLAAATFVRPASYYLPWALALGLFVVLMHQPGLRWKAPAVLLLSVLPWLAAWQVRNDVETGFSGFTSLPVLNLYFYQAAEVRSRIEHRPLGDLQHEYGYENQDAYLALHPQQADWSQVQRLNFMATEAKRVLRAHPWEYLKMHLEGSAAVVFTPCAADLLRLLAAYPEDGPQRVLNVGPSHAALRLLQTHPWLAALMAALEAGLLALYILAVRGVLRGGLQTSALCLLLGVVLYFIAVSGGATAVGRYRLPIMPIVCILAASGLRRGRAAIEAAALETLAPPQVVSG